MALLIPISLPVRLISAPPELPGLMAASVCSRLRKVNGRPSRPGTVISRSRAESTPTVTVCSCPKGLPMAMTVSPTIRSDEVPRGTGGNALPGGGETMRRTARSEAASKVTTSAR